MLDFFWSNHPMLEYDFFMWNAEGTSRNSTGIGKVSSPVKGRLHPDLRNVTLVELLGPELGV